MPTPEEYAKGLAMSVGRAVFLQGTSHAISGRNVITGNPSELSQINTVQVVSINEGQSRPMLATDYLDDALMERIGNRIVSSHLSKQTQYNNQLIQRAIQTGEQKVGNYIIDGASSKYGDVYLKDIFFMKHAGSQAPGMGEFRSVIRTFEAEALNSGAKHISIYGAEVKNNIFFNPRAASLHGYSYQKWGSNGIILNKTLKP